MYRYIHIRPEHSYIKYLYLCYRDDGDENHHHLRACSKIAAIVSPLLLAELACCPSVHSCHRVGCLLHAPHGFEYNMCRMFLPSTQYGRTCLTYCLPVLCVMVHEMCFKIWQGRMQRRFGCFKRAGLLQRRLRRAR